MYITPGLVIYISTRACIINCNNINWRIRRSLMKVCTYLCKESKKFNLNNYIKCCSQNSSFCWTTSERNREYRPRRILLKTSNEVCQKDVCVMQWPELQQSSHVNGKISIKKLELTRAFNIEVEINVVSQR